MTLGGAAAARASLAAHPEAERDAAGREADAMQAAMDAAAAAEEQAIAARWMT
jgi:hypothetical protein